jgi:hypothetical protein
MPEIRGITNGCVVLEVFTPGLYLLLGKEEAVFWGIRVNRAKKSRLAAA